MGAKNRPVQLYLIRFEMELLLENYRNTTNISLSDWQSFILNLKSFILLLTGMSHRDTCRKRRNSGKLICI